MIVEARKNISDFGCGNVDLRAIKTFSEFENLVGFDCFFSRIVFQHNPPPVAYYMLSRILDKLRPGGIAFFQAPTYGFGYSFDADKYLSEPAKGLIEMHVLPQRAIFDLFEEKCCRLLELREDGPRGPAGQFLSNTFFVQKGSGETRTHRE